MFFIYLFENSQFYIQYNKNTREQAGTIGKLRHQGSALTGAAVNTRNITNNVKTGIDVSY